MNAGFFKLGGRLGARWQLFFWAMTIALIPSVTVAADALYSNNGSITTLNIPQVDATNFYNSGTWNIGTTVRYHTSDTLNYTNIGSMVGTVGWDFSWWPASQGTPGWSSSFFNDTLGSVSASPSGAELGYLWISATNIVNKGQLLAGAEAEVLMQGFSVDIHRSVLEVLPIVAQGSGNNFNMQNFAADTGIFDQYWGQAGISNMVSSAIWNGTIATSSPFDVAEPCGITNLLINIGPFVPTISDSTNFIAPGAFVSVGLTNGQGIQYTNLLIPTNVFRQAVFVYFLDTNLTGQISFSQGPVPTNFFKTVAVQLADPYVNFATLLPQTNFVYLVDTLASTTNGGVLVNTVTNPYAECSGATFRPGNFVLSRTDPGAFANGNPGMGEPPANFLFEPDFTNNLVTAKYGAYSAFVDNQALQMPFESVTNSPGQVDISADNLNLSQVRIRGEGEVVIQASNLVSSAGAVIDCQNVAYNLGATNGFLNESNLAGLTVARLNGTVSAWSAVWNNTELVINTNNFAPTNTGTMTNWVVSPITNYIQVGIYALLVDASGLSSTTPVAVQQFALHSTNMVVNDSMTVDEDLLFAGLNLTLNGNILLASTIPDWNTTIAPTLRNFTNNAVLEIPNDAHFGDDGPTNYLSFVNNGFIFDADTTINADDLQINGNILLDTGIIETSAGNFLGICQSGQLSGASVYSSGDLQFAANSLVFSNQNNVLSAQDTLVLNVTNLLSDSGFGANNNFFCQNGFDLLTKPTKGDLKGTTITTVAAYGGAEADHFWAGLDLGATAAGFTNNVAVGDLALDPVGNTNNVIEPLFVFSGTGSHNGLYVSNLDLSLLTDYANEIVIDPSLTIYYLSASLNGTNGAEQFLNNGPFTNRLVWAQSVANFGKKSPSVSSSRFQLSASYIGTGGQVQLSGTIMPDETNIIEASTNLISWVPIYTNIGTYNNIGTSTFTDPNARNYHSRFYRAVPGP